MKSDVYKIERQAEGALPSLVKTNEEVLSVNFSTSHKDANKWFSAGIKKHEEFERGLKQVRRDVVDAAFAFLRARRAFEYGEWGQFLKLHGSKIAPRTVQFYIQIARHSMDWTLREDPKLKTIDDVVAAARELILHSPKPLIELLRDLKFMRTFGEYDNVKYRERKLLGVAQIEFEFDAAANTLDLISRMGDDNFIFKFPAGKTEAEALGELEGKLDVALKKVRAMKKGKVIES